VGSNFFKKKRSDRAQGVYSGGVPKIFQTGPFKVGEVQFKKKRQECACGMHAPGDVFFFFKLAFVDLKRTLYNSDLGKCRGTYRVDSFQARAALTNRNSRVSKNEGAEL
jgi:hypothetical protein